MVGTHYGTIKLIKGQVEVIGKYWKALHIAKNLWRIVYDNPNEAVEMAGGSTDHEYLSIKNPFRLTRIVLLHDSTDNLEITVKMYRQKKMNGTIVYEELYDDITPAQSIIIELGEGYEYPETLLCFDLKTTAGDLVAPIIYVQRLGD